MKSRQLALFIISLIIIPNVGCQSWYNVRDSFFYCEPIDEAIHSYNCHRAAKRAWAARCDSYCERECVDHFGAGFRDGYADVAKGGTGCPPPLPPRRYWGWRYQNADGQQYVASWFDGYPAGARAAEEDGVANWSRMQTSYIIDAQYAARMHGKRPAPPIGAFPGEQLEEVPVPPLAAPGVAPETAVPAPAEAPSGLEEEVRVLRNLDQATPVSSKLADKPKVRVIPRIIAAPAKTQPIAVPIEPLESSPLSANSQSESAAMEPVNTEPVATEFAVSEPTTIEPSQPSVVRNLDLAEAIEVSPPSAPVTVRKLDMPVVEMLSGLSVPKKHAPLVEEATEEEAPEAVAEELEMPVAEEVVAAPKQPALVRAPALAPVAAPKTPSAAAPIAGVVEETPAYSLGKSDASSVGDSAPASSTSIKRGLPPIIPAKPKKQTTPIVRPVEERGRFTKLETSSPAKKVSFESEESDEVPGLRRIGQSK